MNTKEAGKAIKKALDRPWSDETKAVIARLGRVGLVALWLLGGAAGRKSALVLADEFGE